MARKLAHPKSILRLTLVGFFLVAVPLIVALVNAAVSVNRLANQSQRAVFQAVKETQDSRALVEDLIAMERNALQFQVLGDHTLFKAYADKHQRFQETATRLSALPLEASQRRMLTDLQHKEGEVYSVLTAQDRKSEQFNRAVSEFPDLSAAAREILAENSRLIDREVARMQDRAQWTQRTLVWQAAALVPAAILLTLFFTALIMRPIRQMDRAIRRLGDGEFGAPIAVTGPRDLEQLGERLEWLRRQLLELEEEKAKFLRHMSHELKTPLTTLREGSELLGEQVVGELNSQQQEVAELLRSNALQLQRLIEDLLDFSLATGPRSALRPQTLRFDELVRGVVSDHRLALLSNRVRLDARLEPLKVSADPDRLRVVVDNLLSNALKYSPEGGVLTVSLATGEDDTVVLEVTDSGPGIPVQERQRVFDAFFQGSIPCAGHVKGTGLGLSIAREYVQAHGGEIEVVEHQGGGARLRVTLPMGLRPVQVA
ncbi:MAG: ATP-binding protein [Gammaproteobacteria bacterium]